MGVVCWADNTADSAAQKLAQHCKRNIDGFIEKSGNSKGMSLCVIYMPNEKTGVIVLTNKARVADTVNIGRYILMTVNARHTEEINLP